MTPTPAPAWLWRVLKFGPWLGAGALLILPAIAMRFTEEVDWTAFDFVFAAGMFLAVLLPWELAMRSSRNPMRLAGVAGALGTGFVVIWASGAVGVIGSEDNPANLLFLGVVAVAVVGAILARFRAEGVATTLYLTAALQLALGVAALILGLGDEGVSWPVDLIGATVVFTLGWLLSGTLIAQAGRGSESVPGA